MAQVAESPVAPTRVALPRELAHLLTELAIAIQNHTVYPPGHPFLARGAEGVARRLSGLLLDRPTLSLGVAHDQLVIEGVATDRHNPVLAGLALRLHRHRIAAVTLERGLDRDDASALLQLLASDPDRGGDADVLAASATLSRARLHRVHYEELELASGEDEMAVAAEAPRSSQLWLGLARAALADDALTEPEPQAIAVAINEAKEAAYDQVIVGYLMQLAAELRTGDGPGAAEIRRRLADALSRLNPDALSRLVEMGGDVAQRRRFMLDASHGFSADAVVRLVEAASGASRQPMSHSMLRLLTKMAAHADDSHDSAHTAADIALRNQIEALVSGWSLSDANTATYTATLDSLAASSLELSSGQPLPSSAYLTDPVRTLQMALELDAPGPALEGAVRAMCESGRAGELVELLRSAGEGAASEAAWSLLAEPHAVRLLLRQGPEAAAALDQVLARCGPAAIDGLIDEMLDAESRLVRRAALARLVGMGPAVAIEAARRLDDPRWFVIRNLLALLVEVGPPPGFSLAPFLRHEDVRVRREAFKVALRIPEGRSRAMALALADPAPQVQLMGLSDCQHHCPPAAVPLVCGRAADPHTDPELRLVAIRALGHMSEPAALQTLLHLVDGGRSLLRGRRLAPTGPAMLAALSALSSGWRTHPEAAELVALALRSTDPSITTAALARRGDG